MTAEEFWLNGRVEAIELKRCLCCPAEPADRLKLSECAYDQCHQELVEPDRGKDLEKVQKFSECRELIEIPWTRLSSPLFSRHSMGPEICTDLTHLNHTMGLAPMLIPGGHQSASIVEPDQDPPEDLLMVPMVPQDPL